MFEVRLVIIGNLVVGLIYIEELRTNSFILNRALGSRHCYHSASSDTETEAQGS